MSLMGWGQTGWTSPVQAQANLLSRGSRSLVLIGFAPYIKSFHLSLVSVTEMKTSLYYVKRMHHF